LYGVLYCSVLESVWIIVQAITNPPGFYIFYPESLEAQRKIADGFENASTPKINNCAWTPKPSFVDFKSSSIDQNKYLCGGRHMFGLNVKLYLIASIAFLIFQLSMVDPLLPGIQGE
jgi:hypothetical protein